MQLSVLDKYLTSIFPCTRDLPLRDKWVLTVCICLLCSTFCLLCVCCWTYYSVVVLGGCSVESDREVGFEGASVDGVHIVRCALVHTSVHLRGRVDLDFGFDAVIADRPLVDLKQV